MKINYEKPVHFLSTVGNVPYGTCVVFDSAFHQNHNSYDIFIVTSVSSTYASEKAHGKVALVNLRTGHLACVEPSKQCRTVKAEVDVKEVY